jgi:hypothetical protein
MAPARRANADRGLDRTLEVRPMGKAYESGEPANTASTPQICAHCRKVIVKHPGTDRYRSTEPGMAVDRMKCESAPDGHYHAPADQTEMRRILPRVPPAHPQFRTGYPA